MSKEKKLRKPTSVIRDRIEKVDYASSGANTDSRYARIDLELGHSPLGHPMEVDEALRQISPEVLTKYPTPYSDESVITKSIRERFHLSELTHVFFNGDGSYGLLAALLNDLVSKQAVANGAHVIGYGPQFTNIALLADRAEIPYVAVHPPLEMSQDEKLQYLAELLMVKERAPSVVYIDNPNNPTGDSASLETIELLASVTSRKGLDGNSDLLIIDEAYGDFTDDSESAMRLVEDYPHVIVLRSISKGIGLASPRFGYAVTSEALGKYYENIQLVFAVDAVTLMIAQIALDPEVLADFLNRVREETSYVKQYFIEKLQISGIEVFPTKNEVSIFMARGPENFYEKLLSVGIGTENLLTFERTYPGLDSSYVRIRVPASIDEVNEVLARISTIL